MKKTNNNSDKTLFPSSFLSNKTFLVFVLLGTIIFLSWFSYGKAFDYYFWRDDTKVVWLHKYLPSRMYNINAESVARGRVGAILFDYITFTTLGLSPAAHQNFGFVLRVVNTFLLFAFATILFRSRKIGILAAVLSASFIGGLEAYSWVRGIGFMITLVLLTVIFYIHSYYSKSKKFFILALFFVSLSLMMDMWRTLGVIFVVALWEFLQFFSIKPFRSRKDSVIRIAIYIATTYSILNMMRALAGKTNGGGVPIPIFRSLAYAYKNNLFGRFFTSLGNLTRIPFLYTPEEGGLSTGDQTSLYIGITLLIFLGALITLFLIKRKKEYIPWIIILIWIPLFYAPNWLYEQSLVVASTHRYLAFSATVLPIFWAASLAKFRWKKLAIFLFVITILLNLNHARKVVAHDYTIRGKDVVLPLWEKMVATVPVGEVNTMLSIKGESNLLGYVFHWSGEYPFATLKGINSKDKLPIFVNPSLASQMVCDPNTTVPDLIESGVKRVGTNYSLTKAYEWTFTNTGDFVDTTNEFRIEAVRLAGCLWKDQNRIVDKDLLLLNYATQELFDKKKYVFAVILRWQKSKDISLIGYSVVTELYNDTRKLLDTDAQILEFDDEGIATSVVKFELPIDEKQSNLDLSLIVCRENCTQKDGVSSKFILQDILLAHE